MSIQKELVIEAKSINEVFAYKSDIVLRVTLGEVDMSFIEDLDAEVIVKNHNNVLLLQQMESDEIIDYLVNNVELRNELLTALKEV